MSVWYQEKNSSMSIPEFFKGKCIFMTGGSGFIGKVMIEKLLRTCPDIKNIYVLVRPKRGKNIQERVKNLFDVPLFDELKKQNIKAIEKVLGVAGDITQLDLGLNKEDTDTLINNVSIIYHIAASVRFNDFLKSAILTNTRSTRDVITLAKKLKTLDVFVYCSTAYSNCDHDVIEESIYPSKQDWRKAIGMAENCDEMSLQALTEKIIYPMPNTYTYTKGLAERVVFDLCENQIPAIVLRPSIVSPAIKDPIPGWVDNFNGPMTLSLLAGKGILKVVYSDDKVIRDHVFVDNAVNALIIAAWKKATQSDISSIEVYNAASDMNFSQGFNRALVPTIIRNNPADSYLGSAFYYSLQNKTIFYILTLIIHVLPALVIDGVTSLLGKKPRLLKIYRRLLIANVSLSSFMLKTFKINTENYVGLEDNLLECDKPTFSFIQNRSRTDTEGTKAMIIVVWGGMKRFLLNSKSQATEAEIKRYDRVTAFQNTIFLILKSLLLYFVGSKVILPWIAQQLT
ncbi:unnamed protein product [Phaedon cochleariae]|uniref:Fatty acyl-CoA reductase n=1 Tax=Phaedon cochleariae TaxID=80249 RepID=A0A9P0GPQ4_PHACE|nr:unnamed protein product [Phaedon cochleariae]